MSSLRTVAVFATLLAAGCAPPPMGQPPGPPEVGWKHPMTRAVTEYLEFSGMTQPMETVEIRARVKGFLKERHFVEGAAVKQGDLLLVIDEEPFQIQLEAARTRLAEAEAALQQAKVSKSREVAQASLNQVESQLSLARQEEQRISSLREQRVATAADLDQATANREVREAELESARANLDQAVATYDTTILSCKAQVQSAGIAVRDAELNLSYCRMAAPIDGRISHVNVDVGNLVGDGGATVLATIVKVSPIYTYATISEADLLRAPLLKDVGITREDGSKPTVTVELATADQNDYPISGEINYSDPSLDAGTGTLRVRGVFANKDQYLLPGMFVRLRVPVGEIPNATLVPEKALGTGQEGQYVLLIGKENTVQMRQVELGVPIGDMRVVSVPPDRGPALTSQDMVIVDGLLRARPGSTVTPKELNDGLNMALQAPELEGRK